MNPITYSWFNEEKTAILCTYSNMEWTWNDFHEAFQTQKEMIDSVDHAKVHIIVDTRASSWLPKGGSLLSGVNKLGKLKHPRQGHTLIVGATGMIAMVAKVVTNIMGKSRQEIHLLNSMEEVETLVAQLIVDDARTG